MGIRFDWPTPRIALVVFDSVEGRLSYDAAEVFSRGLIYVPWFGSRLLAAAEDGVPADGYRGASGHVGGVDEDAVLQVFPREMNAWKFLTMAPAIAEGGTSLIFASVSRTRIARRGSLRSPLCGTGAR